MSVYDRISKVANSDKGGKVDHADLRVLLKSYDFLVRAINADDDDGERLRRIANASVVLVREELR